MQYFQKTFTIFAVPRLLNCTVNQIQYSRNYTIRRSFSHSFCSAIGGLGRLERATLFLFVLIAIILLMPRPVKNCHSANYSTRMPAYVHETNNPTKKQLKKAFTKLVLSYDVAEPVPLIIQQNLMHAATELALLHQQTGTPISQQTAESISWLNNLHQFFNHLNL